jgi:hypothetical protein
MDGLARDLFVSSNCTIVKQVAKYTEPLLFTVFFFVSSV